MDKIRNEDMEKEYTPVVEDEQTEDDAAAGAAVPAGEPDLLGRGALRGKGLLAFFVRPLWKGLSLFFAPLWKPFQKGADKITRRDWLLFMALIMSVIVLVAAPIIFIRIGNTHQEKDRLYSFFLGEKTYWDDAKFQIDDQNQVRLSDSKGEELNVNGWLFYYEDQDMMFWPFYGMWYSVEDVTCARIERFSKIKYEHETGCSVLMADGSEKQLTGFLYDNQDTYVFLESVTISYNGQTRGLAPLSYVRVYGNKSMELYNYGQEKGEIITLESNPEALFNSGVRVDLKGDVMYYANGIPRLLFVSLEYIDPLGSE